MIARIHGKINIECDSCNEVLDTETSNFNEARQVLKASDWTTKKLDSIWIHLCPDCKNE